jgi:hypothetical protein
VAEPLVDVEKRKAYTLQVDPVKPVTKPRMLLGDIATDDKAPRSLMVDVNKAAPGITIAEALNLIMHIDGFKVYVNALCNNGINSPGTGLYVRCP